MSSALLENGLVSYIEMNPKKLHLLEIFIEDLGGTKIFSFFLKIKTSGKNLHHITNYFYST